MYEDTLGTDWDDISEEEAIRRAYALGVAATFGEGDSEEIDRLRDALDTSYDRSIIDLAYQEGKQEAGVVRADSEADSAEAVWEQLVEGVPGPADRRELEEDANSPVDRPIGATAFPTALERAGLLDGGENLDALGFPDLLGTRPGRDDDAGA
ncbi:hypothetical protein Hbl1158_01550 [Halobaculum sp. CBA1158]|uniref:hypothetical protein n=1 Tax=Halobaculum sp. CBA1158 TaxID=2904243 RepID=UPI001F18B070|nr:hypothetical protein [Halobaculum sp. CBA1158]UIP00084.1 hypothetical protein Hbl1158_01550 [Halobaculum sp. CBA1158]